MTLQSLTHRYQRLRRALERAYSRVPWDGSRIDRIARRMLPIERALAAAQAPWGDLGDSRQQQRSGAPPRR